MGTYVEGGVDTPMPFTGSVDQECLAGYMFFADARMWQEQRLYRECSKWCPRTAFTVKVLVGKEAGLVRKFCLRWVGSHTQLALCKCKDPQDATEVRGILVPFDHTYWDVFEKSSWVEKHVRELHELTRLEWEDIQLEDPFQLPKTKPIFALTVKEDKQEAPDKDFPIIQTSLDLVLKGAMEHSRECAEEVVGKTKGWSHYWVDDRVQLRTPHLQEPFANEIDNFLREGGQLRYRKSEGLFGALVFHEMMSEEKVPEELFQAPTCLSCELTQINTKPVARIFGYGSLLETKSRKRDAPSAHFAIPVKLKSSFGAKRRWSFRSSRTYFTALGMEMCYDGSEEDINGVIFNVNQKDLNALRIRETGYSEHLVQRKHLEYYFEWQKVSDKDELPIYVFIQPSHEIRLPSFDYPILQSYVDICVAGCLEHGDAFVRDFLKTVGDWPNAWLNDRQLARRPWIHQPQWKQIDEILRAHLPKRHMEALYAASMPPIQDEPSQEDVEFVLVRRPRRV